MNELWDLSLPEVLEAWDEYDKRGTSLAGVRALAQEDRFYLLVKVLGREDMLHPWLYERCREVERAPNGFLDLWAREHYKSTIITFAGGIQEVLKDPNVTIGIFSHTRSIAIAFLKQIKREFESNQTLLRAFPDILYANPHRESPSWAAESGIVVKRSANPKEATIEAHGLVDGQPTSRHFSLMIYDDVVTKESVNTPEQIAKTTEAWELSDNLSSVGGRKWHVGTRYSYADTYESMMERGAVEIRLYPATDNGEIDGSPVLFPLDVWKKKVIDQGEATISCQMLQNPLAGNQRMFNVEDIQIYEVRPETLSVYILCDPARSKKKDSDLSGYVVIGIDVGMNKYLLDGYNHKMDLMERWEALRNLYLRWSRAPGVMRIHVGYEGYGAQADLDYFAEQMKKSGLSFEIKELYWPSEGNGSKIDRVQRLGPDFRGHKFFLPYKTDSARLTKNQRMMEDRGYSYRIARPVRRKDNEGNVYDLSDIFRLQAHYFPHGGKKDLIDAAARIYDMEPTAPSSAESMGGILEPEFT